MGSPLSPVIANFYMENFEERALDLTPHKPLCWFRYVDNTFVIWPHVLDKLKDFLNHLNSITQCIQFTIETETEGHFPFLDIDIYRRPDGSWAIKSTINLPIPTSALTLGCTTTLPTSKLYSPH
jgi:hypothetical protein